MDRGTNSNAALTLEDEIAKKTMIFNYMPWSRKGGSQKRSITQSRYGNRPNTVDRNGALNQSTSKLDEDSVKRFNEESQTNLLSRKKLSRGG